MFFAPQAEYQSSEEYKVFSQIAEQFSPRVVSFAGVTTEGVTAEFADYLGVDSLETRIVAMHNNAEDELDKYVFAGEWTVASLSAWVQDFIDGKLEKHFKSEEIPEENDGPVKVIVGKNFEEFVFRDDKHVLVEFYANWCAHCQEVSFVSKRY